MTDKIIYLYIGSTMSSSIGQHMACTFVFRAFEPKLKDAIKSKEYVNFCKDTIYRVLQGLPLSCLLLHFLLDELQRPNIWSRTR